MSADRLKSKHLGALVGPCVLGIREAGPELCGRRGCGAGRGAGGRHKVEISIVDAALATGLYMISTAIQEPTVGAAVIPQP